MIVAGLLVKHKVKVTLPLSPATPDPAAPRPRPRPPACSHLGWRRWDAGATNHLYSLISVSGPRCCLLLSEQMTFRKTSELGGRDGETGRGQEGRGEVWQPPSV